MLPDSTIGIFGKLPAHGDFLHRNLPSKLVNEWDSWLQTFVGSTQEYLGEGWLDTYLTSPIWRFCFSSGVLDEQRWAGIVLPSVDRVGRYFPFSILAALGPQHFPCELLATRQSWFEALESLALKSLEGQLQIDALLDELKALPKLQSSAYQRQATASGAGIVVDMDFEDPAFSGTMPHHLDALAASAYNSYSVWSTMGSDKVEPCSFISNHLPPVSGASALLDGLWEHWGWSVPVRPIAEQDAEGLLE